MKISYLTCTGGRPECFKLCEKFMASQSIRSLKNIEVEWVVVTDPNLSVKTTMGQKVVKGPRAWEPGLNTHRFNMEEGLKHVTGDYIFMVEDDDHLAPEYVKLYLELLTQNFFAVGLSYARYYNVQVPGHKTMLNHSHASLAQTAFKKELLPLMVDAVNSGELYFDVHFWRNLKAKGYPFALLGNTSLSIGIKGMPGREGITDSHRVHNDFMYDYGLATLKAWLPDHWMHYAPFLPKAKAPKNVLGKPPVK